MSLWQKQRGHERLKPKVLLSEMTAQQVSPKISCLLFVDPKAAKAKLRGDFRGEGCRVLFCFYAIGQDYNWALSLQTRKPTWISLPSKSFSFSSWKRGLNSQPASTHWPVQEPGFSSRLKLMEGCGPWEPINNPQLIKHWYPLIGRSNSTFPQVFPGTTKPEKHRNKKKIHEP